MSVIHRRIQILRLSAALAFVATPSFGMDVDETVVQAGVAAAFARTLPDLKLPPPEYFQQTQDFTLATFNAYESKEDWAPRAVLQAAELISTGYISRIFASTQDDVTPDDLAQELSFLERIFNGWIRP